MSNINNVLLQVRGRLQALSIKLWLEPYYFEDLGTIEAELDQLASDFSQNLGISVSTCKVALAELQDGALRKLAARKEFEETGLITLSARRVNKAGTQNIYEVKCLFSALGSELLKIIAEKVGVEDAHRVKCISAGKIVEPTVTLQSQGIKNNQQLMVIISELEQGDAAIYDRIRKIKSDVEAIVDSSRHLFEMEDQDGNPIFMPPAENRALLMAMSYCEKARSAMKRQQYDEALILLLEADEKFTSCNSDFLETVDNYALVNLDIVWCYLCLKNVTQLPDAQRRLAICERNFRRSYGDNMDRLVAFKGNLSLERALFTRLHLLQGVVFFHQNERDRAYERLELAAKELLDLKVNEDSMTMLVEMGYEPFEARLGLRSCGGDIEKSINFIHNRKEKLKATRERTKKERMVNANLSAQIKDDVNWVNPRSVCRLMEMGFQRKLIVVALRQTKNDVPQALNLLQSNADELRAQVSTTDHTIDNTVLEHLKVLGFTDEMARAALDINHNNLDRAIEFLVNSFDNEEEQQLALNRMMDAIAVTGTTDAGPSTSSGVASVLDKMMDKVKHEMESLEAFKRFQDDVSNNEQEYLDLPLVQEEQILAQYKNMLEQ